MGLFNKKFKKGDFVNYITNDGKNIVCEVQGESEDGTNGLILKIYNSPTKFFIPGNKVSTLKKIKKQEPTPEPQPQENNTGPTPNPAPTPSSKQGFGSRAKNGLNSVGRGLLTFEHWLGRGASKTRRWASSQKFDVDVNRTMAEIIMFLALVAHLADFLITGLNPELTNMRLLIYLFLVIITAFFVGQTTHFFSAFIKFAKPALIVVFIIPTLYQLANMFGGASQLMETLSAILLIIPIYVFYLLKFSGIDYTIPGDSFLEKLKNGIIRPSGWAWGIFIACIIIGMSWLFMFLAEIAEDTTQITDTGARIDARTAIKRLGEIIMTPFKYITDTIRSVGPSINRTYTQLYNESLGGYYTGQVEQNKEQTGVFITELNTMGTYFEGHQADFFAVIRARSFVDAINMTPKCFAQDLRNQSNIILGKTNPEEITNLYQDDYRGITCSFDKDELKSGRYELNFFVEFNFETWAYVTLTFMDREFLSSLYAQGVNVHSRYNIRPRTRTIFTNGPVMLGMNDNMEMPIALSTNEGAINHLPIGLTIEDRHASIGTRGELQKVNSFEIRMPQQFDIASERCAIPGGGKLEEPKDDETVPGYKIYSFDVTHTPGKYTTVSCTAILDESGARSLLNDPSGKQDVTIAGSASYDYILRRRITFDVQPTI